MRNGDLAAEARRQGLQGPIRVTAGTMRGVSHTKAQLMDSCEADGLAGASDLLLQHTLHDVVTAQRDRKAAALVVLAVRVHRGPSYPRAPLLWSALLRRPVRRAGMQRAQAAMMRKAWPKSFDWES